MTLLIKATFYLLLAGRCAAIEITGMVDDTLVEDGSKLDLDASELISTVSRANFLHFLPTCDDVRVLFKAFFLPYVLLHVVDDVVAVCITVFRLLHATEVSFVGKHYVSQVVPHSMVIREIDIGLVHEVGVRYHDNLVQLTYGSVGGIDCP